jgi:hypothetical protein
MRWRLGHPAAAGYRAAPAVEPYASWCSWLSDSAADVAAQPLSHQAVETTALAQRQEAGLPGAPSGAASPQRRPPSRCLQS